MLKQACITQDYKSKLNTQFLVVTERLKVLQQQTEQTVVVRVAACDLCLHFPWVGGLYTRGIICGGTPQASKQKIYSACKTTHTRRHIIARRLSCHCDVQTVCLHMQLCYHLAT